MRKIYAIIMLTASLLVLAACSSEVENRQEANDDTMKLTLEELSKYDGKDGRPAYIAVEGIIYDVSEAPPWNGGEHNGFTAGKELTEEMRDISPHGFSKLKLVPAVGELVE